MWLVSMLQHPTCSLSIWWVDEFWPIKIVELSFFNESQLSKEPVVLQAGGILNILGDYRYTVKISRMYSINKVPKILL